MGVARHRFLAVAEVVLAASGATVTELVYGATDHAALRLITCGGTFDRAQRSYRDNVVVFASLVGSHQALQMSYDHVEWVSTALSG